MPHPEPVGETVIKIFVERLNRLSSLNAADAAELAHTCSGVRQLEEGVDLAREGEQPDSLHVMVEGWACRYVLLADGRRHIPSLLLPGDVAELDAFASRPLDYGVSTLTRCRVAALSRPALVAAIERAPGLGRAFIALALEENALLTRRSVSLGRRTARERVASFLVEIVTRLTDSNGATTSGTHGLPLTQAELGDMLGLSTVHVNRVLQGLRGDRVLRLAGDKLDILDWAGLVEAAALRPDDSGGPGFRTFGAVANGRGAPPPADCDRKGPVMA